MKKSIIIGITILSLAALMTLGAWAWFTAEAEATNTFTAGTVKIKLHDGFAGDGIANWNPGDCTDKKIYVKNTGTKKANVRVRLTMAWYDEHGTATGLSTDNVKLGRTGKSWNNGDDGWYYYNNLAPGAKTSCLIKKVRLSGNDTGNEYQGKALKIKVEAQAIQSSNGAKWSDFPVPEEGDQE